MDRSVEKSLLFQCSQEYYLSSKQIGNAKITACLRLWSWIGEATTQQSSLKINREIQRLGQSLWALIKFPHIHYDLEGCVHTQGCIYTQEGMERVLALHTFLAEMRPCACADETQKDQQKIRASKDLEST